MRSDIADLELNIRNQNNSDLTKALKEYILCLKNIDINRLLYCSKEDLPKLQGGILKLNKIYKILA